MAIEVQVRDVAQQYLAVVRRRTTGRNLSMTIRDLLAENAVYTFFKDSGIGQHGHNVFVFWDEPDSALPSNEQPLVIEVGVQVFEPFKGNGYVTCSSTPQGKAAALLHIGPYEQLGRTHSAIIEWCRANHLIMTGLRWEVYGRWNDDPNKLETEVFYLLE